MVVGGADLEFVNNNPAFELYSVLYTNSLLTIAAQKSQVAVNSTLSIDLTGQAAAESIGPQMYSGIGGQMTFMMGSMYSGRGALHHGAAVHGAPRFAVPHCSHAGAGEYADHAPPVHGLCGDGIWYGESSGENATPARRVPD